MPFSPVSTLLPLSLLLIPVAVAAQSPDTIPAAERDGAARPPARGTTPAWPVRGPEPLPGSILPHKRIVAYYGNPLSKGMGILGELPPRQMLERLDRTVAAWEAADPDTPVQPALHLVTVVAQAGPGRDGKYRARMADTLVERVIEWAESRDALVFLDVQLGLSTLQEELPRLVPFLRRPNVHLGLDPEFAMKNGRRPGTRVGTMDARDVNYAVELLADIVAEHDLPPKVLVVHRFTTPMLTNASRIALDPRVQVVIHADGWGPASQKRATYRQVVYREPVQFAGFKIFYRNDTRRGWKLMTPRQVLELEPAPLYVQYQ